MSIRYFLSLFVALYAFTGAFAQNSFAKEQTKADFSVTPMEKIEVCHVAPDHLESIVKDFDIVLHDQKGRGHTAKRHIAISAQELVDILSRKKGDALTSYRDQPTAEQAIKSAIHNGRQRVLAWLNSPDTDEKLKLHYQASTSVGYGITRDNHDLKEVSEFVVILRKDDRCGFFVLTSYPLLRRHR